MPSVPPGTAAWRDRFGRFAPALPACGRPLRVLFLAPMAFMRRVQLLAHGRRLQPGPRLEPGQLPQLLHGPDVPADLPQDHDHGRGRDRGRARNGAPVHLLPGPLRQPPMAAHRPARGHRPVLDELPAARLRVAGDPRRAGRHQPGPAWALGIIDEPSRLFVYNDIGVFIVLVYVYFPFAALALYASLERFDFNQLHAAQDLGARPDQAFRHILLPQIRPGIITACIFVFIPILGEFLTPTARRGRRRASLIAQPGRQLLPGCADRPGRRLRDRHRGCS